MQPSFNSRLHHQLGVGERDVVRGHRNVRLVRLFDDRQIEGWLQLFRPSVPIVDPDLDELGLHLQVVARRLTGFFNRRHRVGHVGSRGVTVGAAARPGDARSGGLEQRGAGHDLVAHLQRHVAPSCTPTAQIRSIDQVADANRGADAVVGQALEVIDQVLTGEVLLRHRAVPIVLVADVTVQVDFRRHHELAGQIDMRGARRHLDLSLPSHPAERVVLNQERGVLDRCTAVAGDEQRTFVDGDAVSAPLSVDDRRARGPDQARNDEHQTRRLHSDH